MTKPTTPPYKPPAEPSSARLNELDARLNELEKELADLRSAIFDVEAYALSLAGLVARYHPALVQWRCDSCLRLVLSHRGERCPRCNKGTAPKPWRATT